MTDRLARGDGSARMIPKYQKNTNSSSGMLRTNSMNAPHSVERIQLFESRAMPMAKPSTLAITMPSTETSSVLRMPTTSMRP